MSSGQPSRSDTALRTSYSYTVAGATEDVTDPRGLVARTVYDDAGRKVTSIANYTGGSTGTANRDNDVYTRFTYSSGLQTEMWVDLDADGNKDVGDDQVTTYVYGVTKSSSLMPSQVASNGLLRMTIYPESSATSGTIESGSSTDAVVNKYNALGQRSAYRDQNGNVIDFTFDKLGRETIRTVTTVGSGVDATVRRIETAYLSRGLANTVSQFGATSGGSALDQVQYSYDDWGNLTKFEQDVDSAIGTSGRAAFSVQYAFSKNAPSNARAMLRRSSMTMPNSTAVTYSYGTGIHADLSRVKELLLPGDLKIASYDYAGAATLVHTELSQPGFYSAIKDGSTYPGWDQFNRIAKNTWKYADRTIYDVDIGHDRNSNITFVQDNVQRTAGGTGGNRAADYVYSIDSLNRVVEALRGEQSGGALVSGKENGGEKWKTSGNALALTQTGNWSTYRQADTGTSYSDETRTHNVVNEINTRVFGGTTYTLAYDANGNLTDDGIDYLYVYDAFNRMITIKEKKSPNAVVQEFKYNGLGYRAGWHYDADASGATDGSDAWYYFTSDERWRMLATYRGSESSPKEQFYYHAAGLAGKGGSSYIDSVIMRDRDNTNEFKGASDGTLEERRYAMQNWRADVCVLVSETAKPTEWVKYSAYGNPYGLPSGDLDADGDVDSTDKSSANTLDLADAYDVRADLDFDGDVDSADVTLMDAKLGEAAGEGKLSTLAAGNRKGYAAYENAGGSIDQLSHVRYRVLDSGIGRWVQRDPAGYIEGGSLLQYASSIPVSRTDSSGLVSAGCTIMPALLADFDIQYYLRRLESLCEGCDKHHNWSHPTIRCCNEGEDSERQGHWNPDTNTICINPGTFDKMKQALIHEIIHAAQECQLRCQSRRDSNLPRPPEPGDPRLPPGGEYIWWAMCSEINAFCSNPFDPFSTLCQTRPSVACEAICRGYNKKKFRYPNLDACQSACESAISSCAKWNPFQD